MAINDEQLQEMACKELETLKDNLIDFLEKNYNKPYELDCRVKTPEKLREKQKLMNYSSIIACKDIIGFRISVDSEDEVLELSRLVESLGPNSVVDYFNKPRETGFKAFLYYFELDINTEIQIMTKEMKEWTNKTHDEHNKRKYGHR